MSGVYEQRLLLGSEHVDCNRRLRTGTLFSLLQTASIRHTEQLGMGREKTLDRGLLWVVARQSVEIERMPAYDERVTLRSWPGETLRLLFPRYYEIAAEDGGTLVRGSAVWSLMDAETRQAVFPDEHGIEIAGVATGQELPYLTNIPAAGTPEGFDFTVPYSFVDLNGHMNNARYFDVAEDLIGAAAAGKTLRAVQAEYRREARMGETLRLAWGADGEAYYVTGAVDEKICFRMRLQYGV